MENIYIVETVEQKNIGKKIQQKNIEMLEKKIDTEKYNLD